MECLNPGYKEWACSGLEGLTMDSKREPITTRKTLNLKLCLGGCVTYPGKKKAWFCLEQESRPSMFTLRA